MRSALALSGTRAPKGAGPGDWLRRGGRGREGQAPPRVHTHTLQPLPALWNPILALLSPPRGRDARSRRYKDGGRGGGGAELRLQSGLGDRGRRSEAGLLPCRRGFQRPPLHRDIPALSRYLPRTTSAMTALGAVGAARVLAALIAVALCGHLQLGVSATLNSVLVNSNAIKNLPPALGGAAGHLGSAVSASPGIPYEGGNKYQTFDNDPVSRVSGSLGRWDPEGGLRWGGARRTCWVCGVWGSVGKSASGSPGHSSFGEVHAEGRWWASGSGSLRTWRRRCLTLCLALPRSRTRALRMRSAARRSTAPAPAAEGARARARKSVWPAGSAENAACVTLCAAPGITAKTVSPVAPFLIQSVPHLASYGWEEKASGFANPAAPPANGCSSCKVPQKSSECLIWEVVGRLVFLRAPGLPNRRA